MIKKRIRPTIGGVAGPAILPQRRLVRIVILVAIKTCLRRIAQRGGRPGAGVAICARQVDMLPGQRKLQAGMIEIGAISIHAIVAGQAILAEIIDMRWDEIGLNNQVTLCTFDLVKTANVPDMAISTLKSSPVRQALVAD
jgi:hypothetical protein